MNHRQLLLKHLASFNLRIDPVSGDGDCAFRSIIVQVQKTQEWNDEESALRLHCLDLGLGKSVNEDVFHLRQLFVDSVQSNNYYQMLTGIPFSEMNAETERFRDQCSFCGDVGDLVIKVCSDILRIPIIVVTSLFFPTLTFPFPLLLAYLMVYCRFTSPSPCSLISPFFVLFFLFPRTKLKNYQ